MVVFTRLLKGIIDSLPKREEIRRTPTSSKASILNVERCHSCCSFVTLLHFQSFGYINFPSKHVSISVSANFIYDYTRCSIMACLSYVNEMSPWQCGG